MSVPYKPNSCLFYHKYSIKSLSKLRETLVKQRSKYKVQLINILDMIFPEFKPFFSHSFGATSLYILEKYKTPEKIANMRDFDSLSKISHSKFTYAKFVKLRDLSKNTIGKSNNIFKLELTSILNLYKDIDEQIIELDKHISTIIKVLNPATLSIPRIDVITCTSFLTLVKCYLLLV